MANWQMRYYSTVGATPSSWWDINSPNNDLTVTATSTRKEHILYTGGKARTIPTTKNNYGNVNINWDFISTTNILLTTAAGKLTLDEIVNAGYMIDFKTHDLTTGVTETWNGYIISYPRIYKLGMYIGSGGNETFYDLSIDFDLIGIT